MTMTVKAIEKRNVTVEVTPKECFKALCRDTGVEQALFPSQNIYWEPIHAEDGYLIKLIEMENRSYHGSPEYEPTGRQINDEKSLALYIHLLAIKKLYKF